jgi:hypothetical protein
MVCSRQRLADSLVIPAVITHESHASEQAARHVGGGRTWGGGNHSWHSTRGTYTSVTYPLGVAAESGPLIARKLDLRQQFSVSFTINLYPDGTPLEKPDFLAIWLCNFFFISRIVKLPGRRVKLFAVGR